MESIDEAIAKAKAQASRLPAIINARKLTMSDLHSMSRAGCRSTNTACTSTSRRRRSRPS
jgi:hypothetical protein